MYTGAPDPEMQAKIALLQQTLNGRDAAVKDTLHKMVFVVSVSKHACIYVYIYYQPPSSFTQFFHGNREKFCARHVMHVNTW